MTTLPWPIEIRLNRDKNKLHIRYDNGASFTLDAEALRVSSPSAEVQGHGQVQGHGKRQEIGAGQRKIITGKEHVKILRIEPVGNYAIKLIFDDGHDTGLYTWTYLYEMGANLSSHSQ
jgi:DUF971 family protein